MGLFLFRFWPVLVPLILYWVWQVVVRRRAVKAGKTPPRFSDGPWYWAVLASLLTALGCFLLIGATIENNKGRYVPPHMEDGKLVPGRVEK
jgi:hypothetical protein